MKKQAKATGKLNQDAGDRAFLVINFKTLAGRVEKNFKKFFWILETFVIILVFKCLMLNYN